MIGILSIGLLASGFLLAILASLQIAKRRDSKVARRVVEVGTGDVLVDDLRPVGGPSFVSRFLAFAATLAPSSLRGRDIRIQLAGAGWYSPEAVRTFIGAKIFFAAALALLGWGVALAMTLPQAQTTLLAAGLGMLGFHAPAMLMKIRTKRRHAAIRLALPDALDLLVVCVEAGLGLNAAIVRVGNEMTLTCPALADELRVVNQEIRAGTQRSTALRNFGSRVPIPDVKSLIAMFVQTDRLGTSVARSLRIHADGLRSRRRQRAEENARKATVKLVFPLVLFIFPVLLVVTLGPAGLKLFQSLSDMALR